MWHFLLRSPLLPSSCLSYPPDSPSLPLPPPPSPNQPNDCHCHSAGIKQGTDGNAYTWGLVNNADPSKGVTLTYSKGEQCAHQGAPDRQVTIRFLCQDTVASTPSRAEETVGFGLSGLGWNGMGWDGMGWDGIV